MKAYKDSGKEQAFKEKTGRAAAEKKMAEKKMKVLAPRLSCCDLLSLLAFV